MRDDIIKFGLVLTMLLAVGTFVLFMIPIFLRNYRKASWWAGKPAGNSMNCVRKSTSCVASRRAWQNWRSASTSPSGS